MRPYLLVFLLALSARLGYLGMRGLPGEPSGDALEYRSYAVSLAREGVYAGPKGERATRLPGYPAFLAALYRVFGRSSAAVVLIQCVLGAATCVFLMSLASRLLAPPWPLLCGLAGAAYHGLVAPCALLLSECLYSFMLVLSLRALFWSERRPGTRAALFGLGSALLYLIRPEPLPYALAVCLLLPFLFRDMGWKDSVKALSAFGLVAGLWVGRNAAVFGRFVPASTVGMTVGYISLRLPLEAGGLDIASRYAPPPEAGELERERGYAAAYRELLGSLSPSALLKAYAFNLASVLYPFLPGYDWTYVVLLPFWLAGLLLAFPRRELWPLAGAVLCSLGIFVFFGGPASRYRQGIAPLLVVLAGAGASALRGRAGAARFDRWASAWACANLALLVLQDQARGLALWVKRAFL